MFYIEHIVLWRYTALYIAGLVILLIGAAVAVCSKGGATNARQHVRGQRWGDCATIIPGFILTSFLNNEECPSPRLMGSGWATRDPSLSHIRPQWASARLPPSSSISHQAPTTRPSPSRP